jgi:hypothetical protein
MMFPEDNGSPTAEVNAGTETWVDENDEDNGAVTLETQTISARPKARAAKKSRWDVSHYLVPANRNAA